MGFTLTSQDLKAKLNFAPQIKPDSEFYLK